MQISGRISLFLTIKKSFHTEMYLVFVCYVLLRKKGLFHSRSSHSKKVCSDKKVFQRHVFVTLKCVFCGWVSSNRKCILIKIHKMEGKKLRIIFLFLPEEEGLSSTSSEKSPFSKLKIIKTFRISCPFQFQQNKSEI